MSFEVSVLSFINEIVYKKLSEHFISTKSLFQPNVNDWDCDADWQYCICKVRFTMNMHAYHELETHE